MSWQMAAVGALGAVQYQQQGAAGKYNQAVANRNAQVAIQEGNQIEKQLKFDLDNFDKKFVKFIGETNVSISMSGAERSGSHLRTLRSNVEQAEIEKNIIDYNAKIGQSRKFEEANFARIQGNIARQQSRMAQLQTISNTGQSLMSMSGGFGSKSQGQFGSTANNSTFSNYS